MKFLTDTNNDTELLSWIRARYGRHLCGMIDDNAILPDSCPRCGAPNSVQKRRRNSAYIDDESNWLISCEMCFDEDTDNLNEQWEDYYSSVL